MHITLHTRMLLAKIRRLRENQRFLVEKNETGSKPYKKQTPQNTMAARGFVEQSLEIQFHIGGNSTRC